MALDGLHGGAVGADEFVVFHVGAVGEAVFAVQAEALFGVGEGAAVFVGWVPEFDAAGHDAAEDGFIAGGHDFDAEGGFDGVEFAAEGEVIDGVGGGAGVGRVHVIGWVEPE